MMRKTQVALVGLLAAVSLQNVASAAVTVPSGFLFTNNDIPGSQPPSASAPGTYTSSFAASSASSSPDPNATASSTATVIIGADPQVRAAANQSGNISTLNGFPTFYDVEAADAYYLEVSGPNNITVPVAINGSGGASISGGGAKLGAGAELTLIALANSSQAYAQYINSTCVGDTSSLDIACRSNTSGTFAVNSVQPLLANSLYEIVINASISDSQENASFSASANVDPTVSIAPAFGDLGYSLVFSSGYSPATAVPEPASFVLLVAGLVGIRLARLSPRARKVYRR